MGIATWHGVVWASSAKFIRSRGRMEISLTGGESGHRLSYSFQYVLHTAQERLYIVQRTGMRKEFMQPRDEEKKFIQGIFIQASRMQRHSLCGPGQLMSRQPLFALPGAVVHCPADVDNASAGVVGDERQQRWIWISAITPSSGRFGASNVGS
ncbi:hypothetical protein VTN77DRAFT_8084 [Rasamsonia byssochlamydoides]|uniref:uncharacterized protein n=1 Tax=Rasamsonia byssochlamydoides TaxID=89139 RepID=UPI0037422B7A